MPSTEDLAAEVRAEMDALASDFASAMRMLEGLGTRMQLTGQKIVSLHKNATNAAKPNPEVNATASTLTTSPTPTPPAAPVTSAAATPPQPPATTTTVPTS